VSDKLFGGSLESIDYRSKKIHPKKYSPGFLSFIRFLVVVVVLAAVLVAAFVNVSLYP